MKSYIILNHGLCNIGGGQLYVSSKKRYMEEIGWNVIVFSYMQGEIFIENLKEYKDNVIPELNVYPMYFFNWTRNSILEKMLDKIPLSEEYMVESNSTSLSCWGELLAEKLKGKHIIYNLNENPEMLRTLYPFFKFKLDRKEIAGITPRSIGDFFSSCEEISNSEDYCLRAYYSQKQVDDIPYTFPDGFTKKGKHTIGICGRLSKPFVYEAAKSVKDYAVRNPQVDFNLVIIGGDDPGTRTSSALRDLFAGVGNCSCYITGYMFPIPLKLVKSLDLGLSSSGAVRTLYREGVKTISIDAGDNLPIGLFGITTDNTLNREKEAKFDYQYWFDKLFVEKEYDDIVIENSEPFDDRSYLKLSSHMDFAEKSSKDKNYKTEFSSGPLLRKIFMEIFGVKFYSLLSKFMKK